ncbi:MAG: hypothetical protein AABY33_02525 [Pseudomonadota bacterium]
MSDTKPKKIRELTAREHHDIYMPFLSAESIAMEAAGVRVFGKDRERDMQYSIPQMVEYLSQKNPDFKGVYAEELVKATRWKNNKDRNSDVVQALKKTGATTIAAAGLAGLFSGQINHELPKHPEYDNNPDKEARMELSDSPHATTELEVRERLAKRADAIDKEREKERQEIDKKRKVITAQSRKDTIDHAKENMVTAGEVAAGVVGTGYAIKVVNNGIKRRRKLNELQADADSQTNGRTR